VGLGTSSLGLEAKKAIAMNRRNNDFIALSFFSGAMGLDLGLEQAGIHTRLVCEYDKWCQQTINTNRPNLPLISDIWNYDAKLIRKAAGLRHNQTIDLVHGGPPCQAFSTAGTRKSFEDQRGNVFLHFLEIALDLNPRYIVIENVRGLLSAPLQHRPHRLRDGLQPLVNREKAGGAIKLVIEILKSAGYSVSFNLYNAANFGSPQIRERVVMVCSRDGKRVQYLSPTHAENGAFDLLPWATFREAVSGLPGEHHHVEFPEERLIYYRMLGPGEYWKHLPPEMQIEALGKSYFSGGGKTGFFRRISWDRPAPTLVTHPAMPATDLGHPEEDRPLSVEEYKRIQEFPDTWAIAGSVIQQYKQIGNAVPLSLGRAIGNVLLANDRGIELPIPPGFRFSRYRNTSDLDFDREARIVKKSQVAQDPLF
jgi:DNA (cytosine-5)-methyltransferase 1